MSQITNTNSLHLLQNKNSNSIWYIDYDFYFSVFEQDFVIYNYLRAKSNVKYNILKRKHVYQFEILKSCVYRIKKSIILNLELIYYRYLKKQYVKYFLNEIFIQLKKSFKQNKFFITYKIGNHTAKFIALQIGVLLEKRIKFKSKIVEKIIKNVSCQGLRIICKGRLNFIDRAKKDYFVINSVPKQKLDAKIDYGFIIANTKKGLQSIKVWVFMLTKINLKYDSTKKNKI